jgi:outer membrane protein OmpA-like peptidoglycan-associated protein
MFRRVVPAAVVVTLCIVPTLEAQIGRVIRRAQDRVERRVEREVDQAVDQAVDCALGDRDCVEKAKADGRPVVIKDADGRVITDASGNPVTDQDEAATAAEKPNTGVWRNYDFVPGDSVWFATDWSTEPVGRFPARQLEFVRGNFEIVERDGMRLLEARSSGVFRIQLPRDLPPQFTLEFLYLLPANHIATQVHFAPLSGSLARTTQDYLYLYHAPGINRAARDRSSTAMGPKITGKLMPYRLQVDSSYAILYVGADRAAQVPNADFPRSRVIEFHVNANERFPAYFSEFVVRAGLDPLYDKLMADGEVTTYGFLFDVNSDRLRPESTPKLEELRAMLADHAELRLEIEGHTDATGEDAHNLDLSKRRAQSVIDYLVASGIAADRLTATGKGETEPIGDNATASGRQQNRRVVIKRT